jgi:hypothetical protein
MGSTEAYGGGSLFGWKKEEKSDKLNVGLLRPDITPLPDPGVAPTVAAVTNPVKTFAGGGLDDLLLTGTYLTPGVRQVVQVKIATEGTPDTIDYRVAYGPRDRFGVEQWGAWVTGVALTDPLVLTGAHGISLDPGATTGHDADDVTTFTFYAEVLKGTFSNVRYCRVKNGVFRTAPSPTASVTFSANKAMKVSVLSWSGNPGETAIFVYATFKGRERCIGRVWGGETVIYVDFPFAEAERETAPTLNESGVNAGFVYADVRQADLVIKYEPLETGRLSSSGVKTDPIAGSVVKTFSIQDALSHAFLTEMLDTLLNSATKYGESAGSWVADGDPVDSPAKKYVRTPAAVNAWDPTSISLTQYKGGSVPPKFQLHAMALKLTGSVKKGQLVAATLTGIAASHSTIGLPVPSDVGGATYDTVPVLEGDRVDAAKDTDPILLKPKTTPATGSFDFEYAVGAGIYGNAKTQSYDETSNAGTIGATEVSDRVELDGLGLFKGSARRPVKVGWGGDVTGLLADHPIFTAPPRPLIPGEGSTPGTPDGTFTGFPAKKIVQPPYTIAHLRLKLDDVVVVVDEFDFDLELPKEVRAYGDEALMGTNIVRTGEAKFEVKIGRDFKDRLFEDYQEEDARFTMSLELLGEFIPISPTYLSTKQRSLIFETDTAYVMDDASPVTSNGAIQETVSLGVVNDLTVTEITDRDC